MESTKSFLFLHCINGLITVLTLSFTEVKWWLFFVFFYIFLFLGASVRLSVLACFLACLLVHFMACLFFFHFSYIMEGRNSRETNDATKSTSCGICFPCLVLLCLDSHLILCPSSFPLLLLLFLCTLMFPLVLPSI